MPHALPQQSFVRLADVHKTYRLGEALVPALRGVTLDLHRGEFTALVGPSGSGKSTLLNMLGCIDEPDRGQVLVEGRVELGDFVRHLPDKLSGGQRQRVAIARALVTSPLLVLADEPTANLDSATSHRIIDLMLRLNQTRHVTFFFSTHDEKLMSRVARIVHITDGSLTSDSAADRTGAPIDGGAAR